MTDHIEVVCVREEKTPQLSQKAVKGRKYLVDRWYWDRRDNFEVVPILDWIRNSGVLEMFHLTSCSHESFLTIDEWRNLQIDRIL